MKQLLERLLELYTNHKVLFMKIEYYDRSYYPRRDALCFFITDMTRMALLDNTEARTLKDYIEFQVDTNESREHPYLFEEGDIESRIQWLKEQIAKL